MSKPASKTLIGAFVLGAMVLVITALMVFGSGKFFAHRNTYVLYFDGSVKGLNVGSPVMFRGVKVGQVTDINLVFDPNDLSAVIPVYIEVDPGNFSSVADSMGPSIFEKVKKYAYLKPLINKGLKAQLQMQSFVTGQLMINLDFYPERQARMVAQDGKYPEIPTIPTSFEQLSKTLQELNLNELYNKFMQTIEGLEKIVSAPGAKDTLPALRDTLKETDETLALMQSAFRDNAKLGYDMNNAIKELNATARSLRSLADYLDRHPEALIRGKKK